MENSNNLYDTFLNHDEEFDSVTSTIGQIYNHLNIEEMSKYYDLDQYNASIPLEIDKIISIMHFNIRSLSKNENELLVTLHSLKKQPDVLVISESFLDSNSMSSFHLENYKDFHVTRGDIKRGGVSIFLKQTLNAELIENYSYIDPELEICTVTIKLADKTYTISGIYRPRSKHLKGEVPPFFHVNGAMRYVNR